MNTLSTIYRDPCSGIDSPACDLATYVNEQAREVMDISIG